MTIQDHVAEKELRMVFHHSGSDPRAEGTFFMELEPEQRVERFRVSVAGNPMEGEILDAEKAKRVYEAIVAKRKDPALLEYYGARLLRVRIFPLPANTDFEVVLNTVEALRPQDGLVRVQTLNAVPASLRSPLRRMSVEAIIRSAHRVREVFSPTHTVEVSRDKAGGATLRYRAEDVLPATPFCFYYGVGEDELGASLLSYREPGEDGAFLLTITPPVGVDPEKRLPRDVVFVVDTSASMNEGGKIDQVRQALGSFLGTLTEQDRFNVVTFSTEGTPLRRDLIPATEDRVAFGRRAVSEIRARGGTNLEEGLRIAIGQSFRAEATRIIVLLSDGVPTVGQRDTEKLVGIARGKGIRVFSFGVGFDLNTQLLDRLAVENGGDRQYVHPQEDLTTVLESFARRIDAPVLADITVDVTGADGEAASTQAYPRRLPDLFRGGSLQVLGRFSTEGPVRVTLSGTGREGKVTRTYDLALAPDARHSFVPRLWAIRKVDFLLDEVRLHGPDRELIGEIVALSKEYGIVTPYTGALIVEDSAEALSAAGVEGRLAESARNAYNGAAEWHLGRNQQDWRNAFSQEAQIAAMNGAIGRGTNAAEVARTMQRQRNVRSRAFYNDGAGWNEAGFASQQARVLRFGSEEYFRFLRENPDAGEVLALGTNVTFQHDHEWIRVE